MNATPASLPDVLEPFKTDAIAKACRVHTDTVLSWRRLERVPRDADTIMLLAEFVRMDAGELLAVIVSDSARLKAA